MSGRAGRGASGATTRAVLLAVVLIGGTSCGVPLSDDPSAIPDDEIPVGLRAADSVPASAPTANELATVWFIRDAALAASTHEVPSPAAAASVVADLLAGPTSADQARGLRSAIPDAAVVVAVTLARGTASIALTAAFAEIPAPDQVLAIGQLVMTLTDLRGIGRVRFLVDDVPIAVPLPGGEASDEAVTRDDYVDLTTLP